MSVRLLGSADLLERSNHANPQSQTDVSFLKDGWDAEAFAQQQIRGLVRQVFFARDEESIRQVVFSGIERETEVRGICSRVAEVLAHERSRTILIITDSISDGRREFDCDARTRAATPCEAATPVSRNIWQLPWDGFETGSLREQLADLRRDFDYVILDVPSTTGSQRAIEVASLADGIILVLSAQHTRRAAARNLVDSLQRAQVRILGTVLADRTFPIPEVLYQHL